MKMKYKIMIILASLIAITFFSGITYSIFNSNSNLIVDQKIAKFVFEAQKLDHLELQLDSLTPGSSKEYLFEVTNTNEVKSNVTLNYQLTIKTFHFMPLVIELYKGEDLIMTCDESYSRNDNNELVCNSLVQEMLNDTEVLDSYKLKIIFPSEYNTLEYADLVDFLDIEIKSWQKIEGEV